MPLKKSELVQQARENQAIIWNSVARAAGAAVGGQMQVANLHVEAIEMSDLIEVNTMAALAIQFTLAHLPNNTHTILIDDVNLAAFYSSLQGTIVAAITEEHIEEARDLFESMVQGFCTGVTQLRVEPTAASSVYIKLDGFQMPENLQRGTHLFRANGTLIFGAASIELTWLFDEEGLLSLLAHSKKQDNTFASAASPSEVGVTGTAPEDAALRLLFDIPLEISVELGRKKMIVKDVLELGAGSIVEINKAAGEPVDVLVNGQHVARGEVVVIEDNFGVRITEILNPAERLARLNDAA